MQSSGSEGYKFVGIKHAWFILQRRIHTCALFDYLLLQKCKDDWRYCTKKSAEDKEKKKEREKERKKGGKTAKIRHTI